MIIGITGKMGAGKSTVAQMLAARLGNTHIVPFAKPLKDFALSMGWNGIKDEKGRRLLQLLGTECGRECIHPDIWLMKWQETIDRLTEETAIGNETFSHRYGEPYQSLTIIADDVRFDNEAMLILEAPDSIIYRVERDCGNQTDDHASERGLSPSIPVVTIPNHRTLAELHETIVELTERLRE